MAVSETTVKVDRRYLRNKTKDDLIVLILQLMEIGAKKDVEIQRLKDKTLVMKAFDAKKIIEIERLKEENKRLLQELDEAESRAVVLERKEAEREKRLRMERFN